MVAIHVNPNLINQLFFLRVTHWLLFDVDFGFLEDTLLFSSSFTRQTWDSRLC